MKTAKRITTALLCLFSASTHLSAGPLLAIGKDGRPLNLNFESGTLKDWITEGDAFANQPIKGDTVAPRNGPGGSSAHEGQFWIGGYEVNGDDRKGTMTSTPFKVTQPWATFLVAGGNWSETRVELWETGAKDAFFKVSGEESENLRPVVVDLKNRVGKQIYIRLVDDRTGHWGHINFDDFKFHTEQPNVTNPIDPKKQVAVPEADKVVFEGLSPEDAAAKMTVPPGFKAMLYAGEPDVKQPIGFAIDDRGRLWVAEAYTYPLRTGIAPKGNSESPAGEQLKDIFGGKDRIVCFEDTDGDGKFNKKTIVAEGLNLVSGIEVGFGGVYVGAAPYLLFLPIENWDSPKAGAPKILLDGWAYQDTHETLNTFTWGPDGWLYGCHGVFTHSNVGKPGSSDAERTRINAGIWRYHPVRKTFEVFAEGTSNPWGIDFDKRGQLFAEACVIPHMFHIIQGARYHRQAGNHFNPYIFDDIKNCADHVHWAGSKGPHAGNGRSDSAGGGHAHAGLMIYQADNWPAEYQDKIFIGNIHGQRINMDVPEQKGSGFLVHHAPDPINFNDRWSQVINFRSGPDGAVYFIDWYDKNQCHHNNTDGHDRSNGRIYRVSYGDVKAPKIDLQKLSNEKLAELLVHKNHWYSRHAQRILQERFASENPGGKTQQLFTGKLYALLMKQKTTEDRLRVLWTLHTTGRGLMGLKDFTEFLRVDAKHNDATVRAWAIQLAAEELSTTERSESEQQRFVKHLAELAREDQSPVVRLYIAAAMQRVPVEQRWEVLAGLNSHSEDADDHNLPLMVWYASEPLAKADAKRALELAEQSHLPNILNFMVRRTAALGTANAMAEIVQSLNRVTTDKARTDILSGLSLALKGQRSAEMPRGWDEVEGKLTASANAEVRAQAQALALTFGSKKALASLRATVVDEKADGNARRTALESLLNAKDPGLAPILQQLLNYPLLRSAALKGLAAYDDSSTPTKILAVYTSMNPEEKRDALNTLASRASFARPLLSAIEKDGSLKRDLSADLIRQLRTLKDAEVNAQLVKVYGAIREASADKKELIEKYKKIYRGGGSQPGDASRGRAVFARTCAQCHTLFEVGGKVGPDLTGSNRGDLDYILENMVDPNAVIPNDYRASTLETKDDRMLTGIVKHQDDKSVTLLTPNETVTVPRNEIASLKQNELSMMPEGLLEPLNEQEIRDLIFYLRQPGQVPLSSGGQ